MGTQIKNVEGLTVRDVQFEIQNGGRFVIFTYTVSILVMTFKRPTDVYFLRSGESAISHSWPYAMLTLVAGWWGIPWGPVYSIMSLSQAFSGKDVTSEVLASMIPKDAPKA